MATSKAVEDKEILKRVKELDSIATTITTLRTKLNSVKNTRIKPTARRDYKDDASFELRFLEVEHRCRMQVLDTIASSKKPIEGLTEKTIEDVVRKTSKEMLKEIPLDKLEKLHARLFGKS